MENKPNNFQSKALSHIPLDIQRSMFESTKVTTEGVSGILEALAKNVPSTSPLSVSQPVPQQEQFISLAVDGYVIKVPSDAFKASVTMLSYIFAVMAKKDKKIAKILDQFKFAMSDSNGEVIYAPKKRKK